MTRSRAKQSTLLLPFVVSSVFLTCSFIILYHYVHIAPHEFASVPFHVKALKLLVRELQLGGESATITARGGAAEDLDSDDGVSSFF